MTRRKVTPGQSGTFTLSTMSGGVLRFSPERSEASIGDRYITLNDQDCRLLRALIEERGQVVTRTDLMLATWGAASQERVAALDHAIDRLRDRLGPVVTIETVIGIGYRLV